MRHLPIFLVTITALLISINATAQDSLYARTIDSLWLQSYNTKLLSKRSVTVGDAKVQYTYYKSSGKMLSIVSLNRSAKENLLFFYVEDKPVMISPSGQQPYFILDDRVVYAQQMRHTPDQVQSLIARAYHYLEQGYKKIKDLKN